MTKMFMLGVFTLISLFSTCYANNQKISFNQVFNTEAYNIGIAQDNEGFIWIGTSDGLIRYDGYSVKQYKAGVGSFSSNIVGDIFVDREGLIWIGTVDGLNVFDKSKNSFRVFKHDPKNTNSISHNMLSWAMGQIAEDQEGLIWIATTNGLNSYNKNTDQFTNFFHNPDNPNSISNNYIQTVYSDKNGIIWIGTKNGLNRYDKRTKTFERYFNDVENPNSLSDDWIYTIIEGSDGYLWIGTNTGGLSKFDRVSKKFTHFKYDPNNPNSLANNNVFFLKEDQQKNIWIGRNYSNPVGLEKYNIETGKFTLFKPDPNNKESLSGKIIQSFLFDHSGIFWVVDDLGPIQKVDILRKKFMLFTHDPKEINSICSNSVTTIIEDAEEVIWMGTNNDGICRYDSKTNTFSNYRHDSNVADSLSHDYAFTVFEDSDKDFWIGSNDGMLSIFDRKNGKVSKRYKVAPSAPMGIIEDKEASGIFWFATSYNGIYRFNKKTGKFNVFQHDKKNPKSLSNGLLTIVFQDEQGTIWVPTIGGGLNRFNKNSKTFTRFVNDVNDPQSISSNDVRGCYVDTRGNFWITTSGGGLNKLDRSTGKFRQYSTNHGFSTDSLMAMLEDDKGNLWISSNKGIFKFNLDLEKVLKIYDRRDGLQGNKFSVVPTNSLKTKDGEMWFAGHKGVNKFKPEKIKHNPFVPPIVLTSFTQNGKAIQFNQAIENVKEINLDWQYNYFEFGFAALNYSLSVKNEYAYMMQGLDQNWYYSGTDRNGRYSAIPPGEYVLKLKGSNNDGLWNEEGISIKIKINPPFWKTWYFYLGIIVIVLGIIIVFIYSFFKIRSNRLMAEQAILRENQTATINKELQEAKERLQQVAENAQEWIWETDSNGLYTYGSPAIEKILGFRPEEIIGKKHFYDLFAPEDKEVQKETAFEFFNQKQTFKAYINRNIDKNGKYVWLSTSGIPIIDDNGDLLGYRGADLNITKSKLAEEQIKASLKEKETLLQEIHHRVKNNMQVIVSLLRIQSRNNKNKKFAVILKESQDRIKSMALVHENLYQSGDLSKIDIHRYSKKLIDGLFRSHGVSTDKIVAKLEIEEISLGLDIAIPFGLIINELISNSLKYAFPRNKKGEIKLTLRSSSADEIELVVQDNGIGISEEVDFRNTESLGLELVIILAEEQLDGRIMLDRSNGSTFTIQFNI